MRRITTSLDKSNFEERFELLEFLCYELELESMCLYIPHTLLRKVNERCKDLPVIVFTNTSQKEFREYLANKIIIEL